MNTAVVTGASSGMGSALVNELLGRGWNVIGLGRDATRMRLAITTAPERFTPVEVDLAEPGEVLAAARDISSRLDGIDLLANVAGVWHDSDRAFYGPKIDEIPVDELLNVMGVGITAPILLTHELIPLMRGRSGALVVNLSGTFNSGGAGWVHYYTSKRALEELTRAVADEYRASGIRVNCISPADTATPAYIRFFPEDAADALTPQYVASYIALMHDASEFRHVSGQIIELRK